ncbi:hypothetical protein [Nonomuraea basaltis]|uniref:hypothetical protein n=1 Tax=Nonomuraea basaltis TaxID=2495887 RepID=UPI00110C5A1D|nr:hypothetical protein [Nonomuraea basaltis]TMS00144.1 hypothetical protein EJK15_03470 [Nonomuraea basaltis]
MTLTTDVYVLDEIAHKDVFLKCNQLVGATEATRFRDEQLTSWRKGARTPDPGKPWNIGNQVDQGLCALLDIYYRPGGPLRAEDNGCEWYCDSGCDNGEHENPACWLEVSFDTAYGYRDEQGRRCGDLHASLVADLGRWLDERGVRWLWYADTLAEVYSGYEPLTRLCTAGAEAADWFRTSVLPAIEAHAHT